MRGDVHTYVILAVPGISTLLLQPIQAIIKVSIYSGQKPITQLRSYPLYSNY